MTSLINSFQDRVSDYMDRTCQAKAGQRILVGISGGIDSVVLLDVLDRLGFKCEGIHINFQLRGNESDKDEKFVRDFCIQRKLPVHTHQAPARTYATENKCSIQMAARELRYSLFAKVADQQRIATVAVGHHSDDQSETLLINLNRGTGLDGIGGIRPKRVLGGQIRLIRPLLMETRSTIHAYADACKLKWQEDSSNLDPKYLRSRLRTQVIPHLNSLTLARSASLVGQWFDEVIKPLIDEHFTAATLDRSLKIKYLRTLPDVLAQQMVIEWLKKCIPQVPVTEMLVTQIIQLINSHPGKRIEIGGVNIWRERDLITFSDSMIKSSYQGSELYPSSDPLLIPGGQLQLDLISDEPAQLNDPNTAWLDAKLLEFPLIVRNWLPGDRIHPLGMQGTKKVSDLLTDKAAPSSQRAKIPVVCSNETIVWVVGYQISHQFRVTKSTDRYARISFKSD